MDTGRYILDGHAPVAEPDLTKCAEWFETAKRTVANDTATVTLSGKNVGEVKVSTIFLGLDHSFGGPRPLLFETMVFGGPLDQECKRYSTWDEAVKGHELMKGRVLEATP